MPSDKVKLNGSLRQARRSAASLNGVVKQQQCMFTFHIIPHSKNSSRNDIGISFWKIGMIDTAVDGSFSEVDEQMIFDKRTAHNALERQRRENLNTKFQELAHTLPGLQTVRRPSKSMIVSKSLEFGKFQSSLHCLLVFSRIDFFLKKSAHIQPPVSQAKYREMRFQYQINQLCKQQQKLLTSENQILEARPFKNPSDQAAAIKASKAPFTTKESPPPTPESSLSGGNEVEIDDSTAGHSSRMSEHAERFMVENTGDNMTFAVPVCQPPPVPDTTEFHPMYWQNYPAMSPLIGADFSPYPEYPRKAVCGDDMTDMLYGPLSTLF
ncbi:hypothetical protein INT44_001561 [Umbelopsis vinacea]|uniref:BHLH domain-containing protein n=1 Tax=Umbelopsis vinacea TaxID=44442 RepID=A0A8H7PQ63_9FUNG|nr:hypothetical protein INT44_001561 [Umbelopsis vinacea]